MNENQIEKIIKKVDWVEVHELIALQSWGMGIWIHGDSKISLHTQGSYPNPNYDGNDRVIVTLTAVGNNRDDRYYLDGWTTMDDDGNIFVDEDGKEISLENAVYECIHDSGANHCEYIDRLKKQVREQMLEEI